MIIIISSSLLIVHIKYKKALFYIYLLKELKTEKDVQLFLNNKTNYYFQKRKQFLKERNIEYAETKLNTFQQKINYLIIHECPECKANLVDKIKIHEYSKKVLGKDICTPILKIYNDVNDINLNDLPDKFMLKCNHGSGMNIFCKDKKEFDLKKAKLKLKEWMNINYGFQSKEFQYLFVKRKIFAAPYLGDRINDYEFFCFNGNPKFLRVQRMLNERTNMRLHNYYDFDWNLLDIETGLKVFKRDPNIIIEKPKNLNLMIDYAKKLSKDFAFLRIDFYDINNIVYLSELTFSPSNTLNTFKNEEQRLYLGSLIDLTKIKPSLFNK